MKLFSNLRFESGQSVKYRVVGIAAIFLAAMLPLAASGPRAWLYRLAGWLAAMVASMFITGVLGVTIDRVAYRPLRGAPRRRWCRWSPAKRSRSSRRS